MHRHLLRVSHNKAMFPHTCIILVTFATTQIRLKKKKVNHVTK